MRPWRTTPFCHIKKLSLGLFLIICGPIQPVLSKTLADHHPDLFEQNHRQANQLSCNLFDLRAPERFNRW
jgi:hypothetical protein